LQSASQPEIGGNVANETNAYERHDSEPEAAQADKKRLRLNALIILLIPVLVGVVLPRPYRGLAPFLFLIPLVISLVNKFRKADEKSGNSPPNQTYPMPHQDHSVEPYFYAPKDPKDPRRYKPIG